MFTFVYIFFVPLCFSLLHYAESHFISIQMLNAFHEQQKNRNFHERESISGNVMHFYCYFYLFLSLSLSLFIFPFSLCPHPRRIKMRSTEKKMIFHNVVLRWTTFHDILKCSELNDSVYKSLTFINFEAMKL